jgi:ABC-type molybdate transport system permease subunit
VQQTSWFRTTAGLATSVVVWAVLLVLDLWLLVADPTHRQQHALLLLAPLVLGGVAVGRLLAARRARAALQRQALDDDA